ncbi:MAG: hypothetical protein Q4G68_13580, partial [Planctomycetia bacterium]|nr:hypothetical protein [Planctomycetia bacterium]
LSLLACDLCKVSREDVEGGPDGGANTTTQKDGYPLSISTLQARDGSFIFLIEKCNILFENRM